MSLPFNRNIPVINRPTLGSRNYMDNRYSVIIPKNESAGIYKIVKMDKTYNLERSSEKFSVPDKLFGNINFYIDYYWKGFVRHQFQCGLLLTGIKGAGKALANDTPVLTPTGWSGIGDIKVGDLVIGDDGRDTTVIGVYPQGTIDLYNVMFEDGRNLDACLEHRWSIYIDDNEHSIVLNTKEIIEKLKNHRLYIDVPKNTSYHGNYNGLSTLLCYICNNSKSTIHIEHDVVETTIEYIRSVGGIATIKKTTSDLVTISYDTKVDKLEITDITFSRNDEATCIAVDNSSKLFVAKDYIVTHNTEVAKVLCNKLVEQGMKVVTITNVRYTPELISFLEELDDVVLFFDEFSKVFPYQSQDKMLTLLSNVNAKRRIVIITENNLNSISQYISSRPGRLRYSKHFNKLDISVVDEYSKYMKVDEKFFEGLISLYNKSLTFAFDHLQALVTEHKDVPELPFDTILDVLNLDEFVSDKFITLSNIIPSKDSETLKNIEIDLEKSTITNSVSLEMLQHGVPAQLTLYGKREGDEESVLINTIVLTKSDIDKVYDDEVIFKLEEVTIECKLEEAGSKSMGSTANTGSMGRFVLGGM